MVLESRHLIGIFLLMVVISGVVFTLGYVLGRSQYYTQVRTAASGTKLPAAPESAPTKPASTPPVNSRTGTPAPTGIPTPSDWDLYRGTEPKSAEPLPKRGKAATAKENAPSPVQPSSRPVRAKTKVLTNSPPIPRGATVLQVAALTREDEALALAETLQQKQFPAFVLTPGPDHYYRIQVGPYSNARSAARARRRLEREGLKAITKH
ncbi:MAG TPA: SPOR domain-containing protein [Candidatus Acidoferrales bacterium]|nr:SPOR domain-containing protein [Candidatus Acidoferrales bacterium]